MKCLGRGRDDILVKEDIVCTREGEEKCLLEELSASRNFLDQVMLWESGE